ncbi:MAG TPA: type II secretion system F family protein [Bacteroidales bacterium]|nr:type II secretion system F family protein [Bacteroidales bacterium]
MAIDISKIKKEKKVDTQPFKLNTSILSKEISLNKGFNDANKQTLYQELSLLMNSGVDINRSLEIIAEHFKKEKDKKTIKDIRNYLIDGKSFSQSMELIEGFSPYEFYSVRIGEESGRLQMILEQLATFYKRKIRQRKQVANAMTYPLLVIITSIVAVGFMLNFVVPVFSEVFKRFNGELPAITQTVISASDFFNKNIFLILIFIVTIIATIIYVRKKEWYRKYYSAILLRLPIAGELTKKIYAARFCHAMSLLISAHVPMIRAIDLVEKMIGFYPFEQVMKEIKKSVMRGEFLYETLQKYDFFDRKLVALVKVAEEVNKMEVVFNELSHQYNDEIEGRISVMSNLLEPILIIIVGAMVGIILIAMYLPLFQLSTSFG